MKKNVLRVVKLMQDLEVSFDDLKNYFEKEEKKATVVIRDASHREGILEIVMKKLELSADEITDNSSLAKDLGADSLDMVEVIMEVEQKFHITIPDVECEKIETFGDLVMITEKYL